MQQSHCQTYHLVNHTAPFCEVFFLHFLVKSLSFPKIVSIWICIVKLTMKTLKISFQKLSWHEWNYALLFYWYFSEIVLLPSWNGCIKEAISKHWLGIFFSTYLVFYCSTPHRACFASRHHVEPFKDTSDWKVISEKGNNKKIFILLFVSLQYIIIMLGS